MQSNFLKQCYVKKKFIYVKVKVCSCFNIILKLGETPYRAETFPRTITSLPKGKLATIKLNNSNKILWPL